MGIPYTRTISLVIGVSTIVGVLLVWETVGRIGLYNPRLFPPPSRIAAAFVQMLMTGEAIEDLGCSLYCYLNGFALGNVLGIMLGMLTGRVKIIQDSLGPLLNLPRSTPLVALIPLAIVLFGIGTQEKIFLVAWGVTFPVWLSTQAGVSEVETEYVWAAQSLGARGWRLYREVYFPRSLPFIIAGIRTAIATGFFALAAAEMAGAFCGVAFRIFYSQQMFRTDKMMASIMIIGFLGITCDRLFVVLMQLLLPWLVGDARARR